MRLLIHLNNLVNYLSQLFGRKKVSLSKKIKDNVKSALKYIDDFEVTAANLATSKGFHYIVCSHIHKPEIRKITDQKNNSIMYLNSGDWIENLSALEYHKGKWSLYHYPNNSKDITVRSDYDELITAETDMNNKELFVRIVKEFQD
jgi:UDP-2,3-diacylglucosamine pyrophosphatase LpxH